MIKAVENLVGGKKKDKIYVFLAGPIQGAPDWQNSVPEISGVEWINPKRDGLDGFNWDKQVDWETQAINMSDYVLFWIPKEVVSIPGRDYAQTTKIELMECLAKGKNVILGIDEEIHTRRYMVYKAGVYGVNKVCKSLEECIEELKKTITHGGTFFTSDTHFGSDRARQLSRRPFNNVRDMDNTMIRQWNKVVRPDSVVYHLGDFGDREVLKYLGGKITLLLGNYENTEMTNSGKPFEEFREELLDLGFHDVIDYREVVQYDLSGTTLYMNHEPLFLKKTDISKNKLAYGLFGHIHGRQKVKEWGIDVGVDCNNYCPMTEDDVRFFIGALKNKYYDENVFC